MLSNDCKTIDLRLGQHFKATTTISKNQQVSLENHLLISHVQWFVSDYAQCTWQVYASKWRRQ